METMRIHKTDLAELASCGIVTVKGCSGCNATVADALAAPECCQIHSSAGDTFDIRREGDVLELTRS